MERNEKSKVIDDAHEYKAHAIDRATSALDQAVIWNVILAMLTWLYLIFGSGPVLTILFAGSAGLLSIFLWINGLRGRWWIQHLLKFLRLLRASWPGLHREIKNMVGGVASKTADSLMIDLIVAFFVLLGAGFLLLEDLTQWPLALLVLVGEVVYLFIASLIKGSAYKLMDDLARMKIQPHLPSDLMEKPKRQQRLELGDDGEIRPTGSDGENGDGDIDPLYLIHN